MAEAADRVPALVTGLVEEIVETRRLLHRTPELSFEERETAAACAARAEALGYSVRTDVGGTGVVADIDGAGPGPTVMIRADIDALPIEERGADDRPAVSQRPGVMHACGHDGHAAITLGVGAVLAELRGEWNGRVRLCFQPAEEVAGGAAPMIAAGAAEGVDAVFGIHLWSPLQVGRVAVTPGPLFGSADEFRITVRGRGGHGGLPHTAIDPMPAAAGIVLALQTLVSRETSPFEPSVVTLGRIEGGQAFNVIAEEVRLRGTIRAFTVELRERLLRRVEEVSRAVAVAHRCEADVTHPNGCPPVVSDAGMAEVVRRAAVASVGAGNVDVAERVTVGDDVSLFLEQAPGCYFLVGAGDHQRGRAVPPHHHPEFDIDERCLPVGVETLTRAALDALAGARA